MGSRPQRGEKPARSPVIGGQMQHPGERTKFQRLEPESHRPAWAYLRLRPRVPAETSTGQIELPRQPGTTAIYSWRAEGGSKPTPWQRPATRLRRDQSVARARRKRRDAT